MKGDRLANEVTDLMRQSRKEGRVAGLMEAAEIVKMSSLPYGWNRAHEDAIDAISVRVVELEKAK